MWKLFKRDRYARIERRKLLTEKQHNAARKKAWKRKKRKEAWRRFKKRVGQFFSDPFTRKAPIAHHSESRTGVGHSGGYDANVDHIKNLQEKRRKKAQKKAWKRKQRAEAWHAFRKRFTHFLAHPFETTKPTAGHRESQHSTSHTREYYAMVEGTKLRAERRHKNAQKRAWRQKQRAEAWRGFKKRFRHFMAHPFARPELTSHQREMARIRMVQRRDRKVVRKKWMARFRKNPWRAIFPHKKRRVEGGGYLYVYNMTRQERKELARKKRREAYGYLKQLISTPQLRNKFGIAFLYSLANYIMAFLLIYVVYQLVTILVASSFKIPVIWYYYKLKFALSDYSPLYTRMGLVTIFAAGPIISLMLAFVFLRLFFTKNAFLKRFQLFYLWGFICGSNMFFGAYIAGFLTRTEFIFTSEWLFMSNVFDVEEIVFTVASFIILLIIGRIVTPLFLVSSGSVTLIKPEFRLYFIISQVILPWLAGVVILFLITLPTYYIPLIIKTITPLLILLPSLFRYNASDYNSIHKAGIIQHNYFRWSIIIVVLALLFFYRIVLNFGLKFL